MYSVSWSCPSPWALFFLSWEHKVIYQLIRYDQSDLLGLFFFEDIILIKSNTAKFEHFSSISGIDIFLQLFFYCKNKSNIFYKLSSQTLFQQTSHWLQFFYLRRNQIKSSQSISGLFRGTWKNGFIWWWNLRSF